MHSLRSVSNLTLQAKGLERQWLKHQTTGDLDDAKVGCWGGGAYWVRPGGIWCNVQ